MTAASTAQMWGFLPIATKRFNSRGQQLKTLGKNHIGQVAKPKNAREFRTLSFDPYFCT